MAIQIVLPRKDPLLPPIHTAALVRTVGDGHIRWDFNRFDQAFAVWANRDDMEDGDQPIGGLSFPITFTFAAIVPFTSANLKSKIDQALKDRATAEGVDINLNAGNRIPDRLRATIAAGVLVAD